MERKTKIRAAKGAVILAAIPFLIHAYEYGPDAGSAGVPRENGTCNQIGCHTGTNVNASGGSVRVTFPNPGVYTPGVTQHLVVTIDDAAQRRWGFELTARLSSDTTKMAGTFSPTDRFTQLICSTLDLIRQQNFATACPANLPLSYIEHTQGGYDRLQPNPGTFEFDWNPPDSDVGEVTIYVAGNAANGDLTSNGDHVYTATYTLVAGGGAPSTPPTPTITDGGVRNAASLALAGLPNGAIAQGSIFVINGSNLGPDGATVQVSAGGKTVAAPVTAGSANQLTAIMPSSATAGSGTVTVTVNGQASSAAAIQISAGSFGINTLNGAGTGPGQIVDADGKPITLMKPAAPGSVVTLTGTGLGATSGDDLAPSKQDVSSTVTLYVGTQQASLQYAGRSGNAPGQDQITFTVPADAINGCYVPVSVVVNNVTSNFASLAVAPAGSACSDGNGFTAAQVQKIQSAGGDTRVATLKLSRTASASSSTVESGAAAFGTYTQGQLASSLGPSQTPSPGGCLVFPFSGSAPGVSDPTQPQALNAGNAISISGPNGAKQLTVPEGSTGIYSAQLASGGTTYLDPGTYTFTGPGGADVGAIEGQLTMPAAVVWSNAASAATVDRSKGLTVSWTGGDPNGFVSISGYAPLAQGSAGAMFTCTAASAAGTFTVPPMVTMALPVSTSGGLTLMGATAPVSFTAQGIDVGLATASSGVSQPAAFQ